MVINGWHRLWIVLSAPWVVVMGFVVIFVGFPDSWSLLLKIAAGLATTIIPPLILYGTGWAIAWVMRGFRL
jgi:hypothetical protein